MIQGCACDRAVSVDNQYYSDYSELIDQHSFNLSSSNFTSSLRYYSQDYLNKFQR